MRKLARLCRILKGVNRRTSIVLLALFALLFTVPVPAHAGNPFFIFAGVFANQGGVKVIGTPTTVNSVPTASGYRAAINGQLAYSQAPSNYKIWPTSIVDGTPAYVLWDVGSSQWSTIPAGGDDVYLVVETRTGLNGWTGPGYVAGAHHVLTSGSNSDISNAEADQNDLVMEPIPTPAINGSSQTSIGLKWTGLYDRSDISPAGTWNDSVVGYTVYRSANGTSTPAAIGTVAQSPGAQVTYTDNTVTQGVPYYYYLTVNYRWASHTPNPWYETIAKGPWSAQLSTGAAADALKFVSLPVNGTSLTKQGPITINSYTLANGNVANMGSAVTMNLSSNSTGTYKFYDYTGGVCGTTVITSVTIAAGGSTASFCYSDSLAGSWTITAAPTNGWSSINQAGQVITVGPFDHFALNLAANETNGAAFTGTNTATAVDLGGNVITNFSSLALGATMSVTGGGALSGNTLAASDFVSGVANITLKSLTYTGTMGAIPFTLTADNGKTGSTTVTILPGALASIKVRDGVSGGGSIVGAKSTTVDNTLTLYAAGYDASGNYRGDVTGTWAVTGSLDGVAGASASTILFSPSHAPTSGTITFSDGAGHNGATGVITVAHGVLASFSLPQTITDQVAGTSFNIGPITALDAKGNLVSDYAATASLSDTTGTLTPATSAVFSGGTLASQTVTLTKAQGGVTVTATDSGKSGSTNAFAVAPGPLHHFTLALAATEANDAPWSGSNTVTARDQWGNALTSFSGQTVTMSVANGATLANNVLAAGDFSSGVADLTAKGLTYTGTAGSVTFTATSGSGKTGTGSVLIQPGATRSIVIRNAAGGAGSAQGAYAMQVGQSLGLHAAGYDISNNYINDVPVTWGRTGTLDAPLSGPINAINYQPMTAYTSGAITADDGAGHTAQTGTINVDRGPLDHFLVTLASPQNDGVAFTGVNTVIAKDIGNNSITDYSTSGSTVTLTVSSPGATLANNVLAKSDFSNGVANLTVNGFKYTGQTGSIVVTATSVSGKTGTSTVLINPGALDHFDLSLSPSQLVNTAFTGVNTLTARDIGGNAITGFNALVDNVTLTFSPASGGTTAPTGLEAPGNVLAASGDFVNGVANLAGRLTHPGPSGGYVFTATSMSGKTGVSAPVELDVGPLHHFGFSLITEQRAGQGFQVTITAYAQDPVGNNEVKATYAGTVTLTDDSGTVLPASIGPFVNGQAIATLTITKAMVGDILHAKDTGTPSIIGTSNAFDILGGALDHFTVVSNVNNQAAGVPFDLGRIEARDAWDNVVPDFVSSVTLSDPTGTLAPASTDPFVAGVLATLPVTITKTKTADIITLASGVARGSTNPFNVNPGAVSTVAISDQAGGAGPAFGSRLMSVDDTITLYAIGYDAYNNYVTEVPGTWGVTGNLDAAPSGTHPSITYAPANAPRSGTITFNATGVATSTGTITVKHGAIASFAFAVPASERVGVPLTTPATLTALDAKGNTVLDYNASVDNVTFSASSGGAIVGLGTNNDNVINTAPSFVNGVADLNGLGLLYAGTTGTLRLQATSASGKSGTSGNLNFTTGPLDHFNFAFGGVQKNGIAFTTPATLTAVDLGNNTVTGFDAGSDIVTLSTTPADGVLGGLSGGATLNLGSDFGSGVATLAGKLTFTGTKGPHTLLATSASGKTGTAALEVLPGDLSYLQVRNAPGGAGGVVGNQSLKAGDTLALWAAAYDASDNFIQDQTSSWIGTGAAATFLVPVNGAGTSFNATVPGTGVVVASAGAIHAQTGTLTISTGSVAKLVFSTYPYDGAYALTPPPPHSDNPPLIATKPSGPITVEAQDIVGNVVTVAGGIDFTLSTTGSGSFSDSAGSWSSINTAQIPDGQSAHTIYYKDGISGRYTLAIAPAQPSVSGTSQPVLVNPVYDTSLVFINAPLSVKAGVVGGPLTVELQGSDGSPATSTDVVNIALTSNSPTAGKFFFDSGGSAQITSLNLQPGGSDVSFYYRDTAAGNFVLSAKTANVSDGYQNILVKPSDPVRLFITPGPLQTDGQNIIQNYSSDKIDVQMLDLYGNVVTAAADTSIHLASANATGEFSGDGTSGSWLPTTGGPTVVIKAGTTDGYFYYRDSTLGQVTVTASSQPEATWTSGTQIETIYAPVISKLAFLTPSQAIDTNVPSSVITIQAEDALGNAIPTASDVSISLITSDSAAGSFALSLTGPWNATAVTIPSGQSTATFYYKDGTPGQKNLGISETPSLGWADAVQPITINAGAPAKLAFVSAQQTISKNTASGAFIVELQDANGYPTVTPTDLPLTLTTDSANGAFAVSSLTGPWSINTVTILAGQSSAAFYYRDQQPGTYTIKAKAAPWSAQQTVSVTEGVISQLNFVSALQSIAADTPSALITVEAQNSQGDPVKVAADTTLTLGSDSTTGQFAQTPSGPWGITSVLIPAGQSTATFAYKDSSPGTFVLSAAESPSKGWADGSQQIVIGSVESTVAAVKFITQPQVGAAAVPSGEASKIMTVETESSLGNAVLVPQVTYIVITSDSSSGRFSSSPSGPFNTSIVLTIRPGQSQQSFYYLDTVQGTATLTASEFPSVGWTDDTQKVDIAAGNITQLAYATPVQSVLKGALSGAISIQTRDVYGNAKAVDAPTTVTLHSDSGTGVFYDDPSGTTPVTSVVIPTGASDVTAYYQDTVSGTYSLTSAASGQSWAPAVQSITVGDSTLSRIVIKPNYALLPTGTNVQMSAVGYNALGNPIPDLAISWQVNNPAAGDITTDGVLATRDNTGVYDDAVVASAGGVSAAATIQVYAAPQGGPSAPTLATVQFGAPPSVTAAPTNALVLINDGAPETVDRAVTLSLYAAGASYMEISEKKDFSDASWTNYLPSAKRTLSAGLGQKILYVKYRSAGGAESAIANSSIKLVDKLSAGSSSAGNTTVEQLIKQYNYYILTNSPGSSPTLPQIISPAPNSYVVENDLTITGSAPPNTIVTLHIHSAQALTAKVVTDAAGRFVYHFNEAALDQGSHSVYASVETNGAELIGPPAGFDLLVNAASSPGLFAWFSFGTPGTATLLALALIWIILVGSACFGLLRLWLQLRRRGALASLPALSGPVRWLVVAGIVGVVASLALILLMTLYLFSGSASAPAPVAPAQETPVAVPVSVPVPVRTASTSPVVATSTPAAAGKVRVDASRYGYVNVRGTASASGKLIGKIMESVTLDYVAQKSGWYEVVLSDGTKGWISGTYAKKQ